MNRDEADPAFDHPPGEQAIASETFKGLRATATFRDQAAAITVHAVSVERLLWFLRESGEFGSGELHACRQLIRRNSARDFRIGHDLLPHSIEVAKGIQAVV